MTVPASTLTELRSRDYPAIRKLVRTGDPALCSGRDQFSRTIRFAADPRMKPVARASPDPRVPHAAR